MKTVTLDLSSVQTMDDFHDLVISVFGFPEYYGRNLDAFWDCINDCAKPAPVEIANFDSVPAEIQPSILRYIELLGEKSCIIPECDD